MYYIESFYTKIIPYFLTIVILSLVTYQYPTFQVRKCRFRVIRDMLIFSQAIIRIDNDLTSLSYRPNIVLDHCLGNLPQYLVDAMF